MYAQVLPEIVDSKIHGGQPRSKCLLSDTVLRADGIGDAVDLSDYRGKLLVVTLGINAVVERTGLTVSVWGSPDQLDWGTKALVTFRQRQYCGVYSVLLNLAHCPDVRSLRVQWSMSRWGKGERTRSVRLRSISGRIRRARQWFRGLEVRSEFAHTIGSRSPATPPATTVEPQYRSRIPTHCARPAPSGPAASPPGSSAD